MDGEDINNDFVVAPDTTPVDDKVQTFIDNLGIDIDPKKLRIALCHRSFIFENNYIENIEPKLLESLGYSLLNLIACIGRFKDSKTTNKKLTDAISSDKLRISISFYKNNNLNDIILFGKGERINHKDFYQDIVHQVIFSIYEQTNFYKVYEVMNKFSINENPLNDYKTYLQEYAQKHKQVPQYKVIKEHGPDHAKQFEVELTIMGQTVRAIGKSKKLADQEAAKLFISKNQLQVTNNTKIESSPLRLGNNWEVSAVRRKQLTPLHGFLGLDHSKLPLYMLDACFTSKSFLSENKQAVGESYDNLALLGSAVLTFAIDLELKKYFETICEGSVGRFTYYKGRLISTDNLSKLFKPEWLIILKRGNDSTFLESKEVKSNIVQAIIGAIFLNSFQNKAADPFEMVSKIVNKLIPIHREEIESGEDTLID